MVLFLLGLFIGTIMGILVISLCRISADSSEDRLPRKFSGEPKGKQIYP
jgi:hypothetical protein